MAAPRPLQIYKQISISVPSAFRRTTGTYQPSDEPPLVNILPGVSICRCFHTRAMEKNIVRLNRHTVQGSGALTIIADSFAENGSVLWHDLPQFAEYSWNGRHSSTACLGLLLFGFFKECLMCLLDNLSASLEVASVCFGEFIGDVCGELLACKFAICFRP